MKFSLIVLIVLIHTFSTVKAQTDTIPPVYDGWKNGNNTFRLNIKTLQSYFTKPYTVKQFEKTLGHYERRWYDSDTTNYPDDGSFKVEMPYTLLYKDSRFDIVNLTYCSDQKIVEISFKIEEDQVRIDKIGNFVNQLKAAGYKYDLGLTRIYKKLTGSRQKIYLLNSVNKVGVSIFYVEDEYSWVHVGKKLSF